ncbi:MAG TPA: hypothetical protein PKC30_07185 [Saprospiraceae bacterium]|nr:hypothetical protein [Saprospiraceae bacterium]
MDSRSIHRENAKPEDFQVWKNFVKLARAGIASEQGNNEEFEEVTSMVIFRFIYRTKYF